MLINIACLILDGIFYPSESTSNQLKFVFIPTVIKILSKKEPLHQKLK